MTDLSVERITERGGPEPLFPADPVPEREVGAVTPPEGVRLARLIALAGLSPAQAVEIGAAVLTQCSEPEARGEVTVGSDGRVVLVPHDTGASVPALLAELAAAARLRARDQDDLVAELDRAVAELPVDGAAAAARRLAQACADIDRARVRDELAALARAISGGAGAGPVGAGPGGAPRPARAARNRVAHPVPVRTRPVARRIGAWLLSVAVLVGVVALEVAFLRDDIVADVGLLLDAGRSGSTPTAAVAAQPDGLPVVLPAPGSAGAVAAVDLRALEPCGAGSACPVRVLVRLVPGSGPRTVTWSYWFMDRCTGETDSAPGGTVAVPDGAVQAVAVGTVTLPQRAAVAVAAVTGQPATAAAPPVLVGSCGPDPAG